GGGGRRFLTKTGHLAHFHAQAKRHMKRRWSKEIDDFLGDGQVAQRGTAGVAATNLDDHRQAGQLPQAIVEDERIAPVAVGMARIARQFAHHEGIVAIAVIFRFLRAAHDGIVELETLQRHLALDGFRLRFRSSGQDVENQFFAFQSAETLAEVGVIEGAGLQVVLEFLDLIGMVRIGGGHDDFTRLQRKGTRGGGGAVAHHGLPARILLRLGVQTQLFGRRDADNRIGIVLFATRKKIDRTLILRLALAVVHLEREGNFLILSGEDDFHAQVVEDRIANAVEVADERAGGDALLPQRRTGIDPADDGRRFLNAVVIVNEDEQDAAEQDVHDDAGRDNQHALADGFVLERTRIVLVLVGFGALADHVDVTAQRQNGDLVGRFAALETTTGQGGTEADAEGLHMHIAPLGGQEMAQFVDEDNEAESEADLADNPNAIESEFVPNETENSAENKHPGTVAHHPGGGRQR